MMMKEKYKVTQKFMDELKDWREKNYLDATSGDPLSYVDSLSLTKKSDVVGMWWMHTTDPIERNNRLIAIIQWLNGEDVFEVEKSHKFVVRSDKKDREGDYAYVLVENGLTTASYFFNSATRFDTREEAQEWANSHQVVVEIDEYENKVE